MHSAAKFQFERIMQEYADWRAVDADQRSPAAAWWWGPALALRDDAGPMPPQFCRMTELPLGSTYASGAAVLMAAIAKQTRMPWPDDFPRISRRDEREDATAT